MEIIIETPNLNDLNQINKLAKQVHDIHVNWRPDLFKKVEEVISREQLEELIANKEIFVAKLENRIVGYVTIKIVEKTNPSMRYRVQISIEAICVDEKARGKGIGTKLLEFVKEFGKQNGCTDMYLTVNEENENAINLYEKFGFRVKSIAYSMEI